MLALQNHLEEINQEMKNNDKILSNLKLNTFQLRNEPENNLITKHIENISKTLLKIKDNPTVNLQSLSYMNKKNSGELEGLVIDNEINSQSNVINPNTNFTSSNILKSEIEIINEQLNRIQKSLQENLVLNDIQYKNFLGNNFLTLRLEGIIGNFKVFRNSKNKFFIVAETTNLEYSYDEFGIVNSVYNMSYDDIDYQIRSNYYYEEDYEYHYDYEYNFDHDYCFDDYSVKYIFDINWEETSQLTQHKMIFEKFKIFFFNNSWIIIEINNFFKIKIYNFEDNLKELMLESIVSKCRCHYNYFDNIIKDKEIKIFTIANDQKVFIISYESSKMFNCNLDHVIIFDLESGKIISYICIDEFTDSFSFFTDFVIFPRQSRNIITFICHKTIYAFDLMSKKKVWEIVESKPINFVKLLCFKNVSFIVSGNIDGELNFYQPENGVICFKIEGGVCRNFLKFFTFTSSNKIGLMTRKDSNSSTSQIQVWNPENGTIISTIETVLGKNQPKLFTLLNKQVVIITREDPDENSIEEKIIFSIWNPETGSLIKKIVIDSGGNKRSCYLITQLSNNQDVLITVFKNLINIWSLTNGELIKVISGHDGNITGLKVINYLDVNILISSELKYVLKLWTL